MPQLGTPLPNVSGKSDNTLIRLESDFQTIIDASRAILEVFDNPLLRRHYMLDDRLVDQLSSPEPEVCLDTLRGMEKLLNIEHEAQAFSGFTPTSTGYQEDSIHMAIIVRTSPQSLKVS